jgi:hypothetical protein
VGANGQTGPVVSVWSGGVGLVCGMKRGILCAGIAAYGFTSEAGFEPSRSEREVTPTGSSLSARDWAAPMWLDATTMVNSLEMRTHHRDVSSAQISARRRGAERMMSRA